LMLTFLSFIQWEVFSCLNYPETPRSQEWIDPRWWNRHFTSLQVTRSLTPEYNPTRGILPAWYHSSKCQSRGWCRWWCHYRSSPESQPLVSYWVKGRIGRGYDRGAPFSWTAAAFLSCTFALQV
jgi:hypothetical protein